MLKSDNVYKRNNPFENRKLDALRIKKKFVGRVPIIVEVNKNTNQEISLDKTKYLVTSDISVAQFLYVIRKRITVPHQVALFIFFNNSIPPSSTIIGNVYEKHKDPDGFLYAVVSLESTFG
jgi:GABA(A) receptor-associated protein